jgi:Protein of unknown function DUF45
MPDVTLFDLADLTDPDPGCPLGAPPTVQPVVESDPVTFWIEGEEPDGQIEGQAPEVEAGPGPDPDVEVEVRISKRRKKTSEAKWVGGRIVVSLPSHLDVESRQKTIDWLVERLLTRHRLQSGLDDDGLLARAIELSDRYLVGAYPKSVRWVTNQTARWGSCSYYSGQIRISHRLRVVPEWVLDSVLVHEIAHLTYPDHSPAFHKLAGAYPRHEEAGVFLAGYGLGLSNPTPQRPDSSEH